MQQAGAGRTMERNEYRGVAQWLIVCCALVFAMVVLGGVTRLTHSGLSIVEWQPIAGTLPPMTDAQWQELFAKYRETPEYRYVNAGMTLEGFKGIFWLEYFHRLLGRVIGLAFLLPFAYFLWRGTVRGRLAGTLGLVFVLGALQGVIGWLMVQSGLVSDPRVSAHRLALHLMLAFAIYAAMLWIALDLLADRRAPASAAGSGALRGLSTAVVAVVALMALTGAYVAGIRAGLAYNTFPLMNGRLIPPEIWMLEPWWRNFFSNMATVQLTHRLSAWLLAVLVVALWFSARRPGTPQRVRILSHALLGAFLLQFSLGIATLLLAVPVALGAAHQGGALVVFTVALVLAHALRASAEPRGSGLAVAVASR
jgi:heme a synthase